MHCEGNLEREQIFYINVDLLNGKSENFHHQQYSQKGVKELLIASMKK